MTERLLKFGFLGMIGLFISIYWTAMSELVARWLDEPEYGHGFLLLGCALYIAWYKRNVRYLDRCGRKLCFIPMVLSLILYWLGTLAALQIALQLSMILTVLAIIVALFGVTSLRHLGFPLILLALAIPLPYFVESQLTAGLQLLSSKLAVKLIESIGMPVYLQGNVIDLGAIQLEVVEACSGLRYLYPLISLGVLVSYFYKAPWWRRSLLIASTIPLTILMNSARIAITAWLVDRYGVAAAEGFFHDFEGLLIFFICMVSLVLEIVVLEAVFSRQTLWQALEFEIDEISAQSRMPAAFSYPALLGIAGMLFIMLLWGQFESRRAGPELASNLINFPIQYSDWRGEHIDLSDYKLQRLQVDDYLLANFYNQKSNTPVNLYVAYYARQTAGISPHSPKVCMPGGGWGIAKFEQLVTNETPVNEVLIERQGDRQLVHYWFVERGVSMVSEYRRKWSLLKDAMLTGRTDGALVRVTTPINSSESIDDARARLLSLRHHVDAPILEYLPKP